MSDGVWKRMMVPAMLALGVAAMAQAQDRSPDSPVVVPASQTPASTASTAANVLARSFAVRLDRVSLRKALATVSQLANVQLVFSGTHVPLERVVSLVADKITLGNALNTLLADVPLVPVVKSGSTVWLEPAPEGSALNGLQQGTATVAGNVTDSATGSPIAQVAVRVDGTGLTAQTGKDGHFTISGIPAGEYHLSARRVGYVAKTRTVTLAENEKKTVNFDLSQPATKLDEVVTTAVGDQRRYQVGNVISSINVDSLAPTAPVTSVTDLIAGRAPGVDVMENSGLVGSGQPIRIRGISTMLLQSDPIVIVDGIREDDSPGSGLSTGTGINTSHLTPSRLDDLDFNDIATIDILKGPAATTEYGTDAANGVVVITTKHGNSGSPLWHADAQQATAGIPSKSPPMYYSWGHKSGGSNDAINCPLALGTFVGITYYSTGGNCVVDSITEFNPLNTKSTTPYTSGASSRYDLSVSGGSEAIRYFISGGLSSSNGPIQTPQVFKQLAQQYQVPLPGAAFNSNTEQQQQARMNTAITLSKHSDLTLAATYMSTATQSPNSAGLVEGPEYGVAVDDAAHEWGYGNPLFGLNYYNSPLAELSDIGQDHSTRMTGGATANWRPTDWFTGHVTVGLDHGSDAQQSTQYPLGPSVVSSRPQGGITVGSLTNDVYTLDLRGSATAAVSQGLRAITSLGLQLAENRSNGLVVSAYNITDENLTIDGYPNTYEYPQQANSDAATLGGYAEEQLAIADRLFLIGALRVDAASGFGNQYSTATYPKASFSWLALKTGETSLRIRGAWGGAGQQPPNGEALQLYSSYGTYLQGNPSVPNYSISSPGNPNLRPETSSEFEGGFDINGWGNRLTVEFTAYKKTTSNALENVSLGYDLGNFSIEENLGEVSNTGVEGSATIGVIQSREVEWDVTVNGSVNHNKLVSLSASAVPDNYLFNETQNVVGYPLYGAWGVPERYVDANHDGILELNEVTQEDSGYEHTYEGPGEPTQTASLATHLALWHGTLTFGGLLDYAGGYRLYNGWGNIQAYDGVPNGENIPTAPLWIQARDVQVAEYGGQTSGFTEDGTFIRFRELSGTYALPRSVARSLGFVQNLSFTVAVRNLALWTRYTGQDPETNNGYGGNQTDYFSTGYSTINNDVRSDYGAVPLLRNWMFRLNVDLK